MSFPAVQLLVSLGGGGNQHGAVQAAFGQTVQVSASSTAGWNSALWQIYDYPPGLTLPSGWSVDASGVYYFAPPNPTTLPPSFAMPSSGANNWGRFMLRLRINGNPLQINADGTLNAAYIAGNTDESTILYIPSPGAGQPGIGFNETSQADALRLQYGPLMASLRALDAAIGGAMVAVSTSGTSSASREAVDTSVASVTRTLPASPVDGQLQAYKDDPHTGGNGVRGNWAANPITIQANAGQYLEIPSAPGTYTAAAGSITSNVNGDFLAWRWRAAKSSWQLVTG